MHDVLIVGRTAGVSASAHNHRTFVRDNAFTSGNDTLNQGWRGQRPVLHVEVTQAMVFQAILAGNTHNIAHRSLLW